MDSHKVVLVTGCGSGFGKLTAVALANRGYRVFATLREPLTRDAAAKQELEKEGAHGGRVFPLEMDISSDASVAAGFQELRRFTQRLDAVVNNAGISAMGLTEGFTSEQYSTLLQVNALGAHRVNRQALELMKPARSGLLVHVSTGLSRTPLPCFGVYAASKAALEAMAETYRYELSPLGIDSVIVQPAAFPTRLGASAFSPAERDRLAAYGELATLPERMMSGLSQWFSGPNAPNPQLVASAIVALIEAAPGTRPLRTTVGGGPDELNALTDRMQQEVLSSQGLGHLLKLDTRAASAR